MNSEQLYLSIVNNLSDGVYFVTKDRRITFWNKAAEKISGYRADEIVGSYCQDNLLNHIDYSGKPLCVVGCPLYASIVDGKQRKNEAFLRHKEGHRIPVMVNIFPIIENGEIAGAIEIFTPNSPTVYEDDLIEQLSNMAMRDALTGMPNRRYLQSFIEYKLSEFKKFNTPFAALFMDIDNFRDFNNKYGHAMGDTVLKNISESIKKSTRKSDFFGRWGGEEFLGIYSVKNIRDAACAAEKVRILVENTVIPYSTHLSVTASIGITLIKSSDSAETLIERADQLMYQSKILGKNCITAL